MDRSVEHFGLIPERRVRVGESCKRLGISRRTLYRRIADGLYPKLLREVGIAYYFESTLSKIMQGGIR
jgi:predicted site-specific integrase-resolvase